MAQVLEKYNFTRGRYDWDTWFNGDIWQLEQGEDFEVDPASFRSTITAAARRYEVSVRTAVNGNSVVLQAMTE